MAEDWARNPIGDYDYSITIMYTWTTVGLTIEEFGEVAWHCWALVRCRPRPGEYGKRIVVWDPNFGRDMGGVRERSLLGFHRVCVCGGWEAKE